MGFGANIRKLRTMEHLGQALLRFDNDDGKCALHFVDSRVFVGDDSFICELYGQTVFLANKFIAGATEERL